MVDSGLRQELHAKGLRLTAQRERVLAAVQRLGHATPDALTAEVRSAGINASTVYRTLDLLEELGLVTHTHLDHGAPTYHAVTDDDHIHLVCRSCGEVTQADAALVADVADRLAVGSGFSVDVRHLALFGECARCRATGPS